MSELKDLKARERIVSELDTNFFVEAGAGSGKTYCLVERMINLIKHGKSGMENIAAVTFTRKAAAELKERFQIKLERCLFEDKELNDKQRQNIRKALFNLEQIFIGTIHSFCAKILRERPVEAGLDPGFEEIEEQQNYVYAENAWANFLDYSYADSSALLDSFEKYGINAGDLKDSFLNLINYPDAQAETMEIKEPDLSDFKKTARHFIESLKKVLPKQIPENGWDPVQSYIKRCAYFIDEGYLENKRLILKLINALNKSPKATLNRWPEKEGRIYEEQINSFIKEHAEPALKAIQEYLHKPIMDFLKEGTEYYDQQRQKSCILNFTDLLSKTAELLRNNSEARIYFKKRFRHILVDEFQDTDPIQAELILYLTGKDTDSKDWKNIVPDKGALFLVGDPKQSIYRFRRADIDIYNTVKHIFTKEGCSQLVLYSNFRSLPFMQEVVEKVFKNIMPQKEDSYQAKYSSLNTTRKNDESCSFGIFENAVGKVEKDSAEKAAEKDAEIIADYIYRAVNKNEIRLERTKEETDEGLSQKPVYSDFLILAKKRKNLGIYARALENRGIFYEISGGLTFNESAELAEILKLFKAVEDDRDPVALISALRGLFFGISDKALYNFKKADGIFSYFIQPPAGFPEFEDAFKRLKSFREIIEKNSACTAAEIIIEKSAIIPFALSEEEGLTRAGNIFKAKELLKDFEMSEAETFYELVRKFEELLNNEDTESMSLSVNNKNAVRLMNLHKAKGLEAPVVILVDPLGETKEREPLLHINRTEGNKSKGYFTITRNTSNFTSEIIAIPPRWEDKKEEEKRYLDAESRRLDYVAVTRAKNILIVSTYIDSKRPKAWNILYDFLQTAPKLDNKSLQCINEREKLYIEDSEYKNEMEKINRNIENLNEPSYERTSVTSEVKDSLVFTKTAGQGAKFGSIAHKAVEHVCKQGEGNISLKIKKWAKDEGLDEKAVEGLKDIADNFIKSPLYERIKKSDEKYFELTFASRTENGIIQGVIDIVFKEDEAWVIVDYKTDDYEADPERKKTYEKQLSAYRAYWESLTGEKVSETFLHRLK